MILTMMLGGSVGGISPLSLKAILSCANGNGNPIAVPGGDQTPYDPKTFTPAPIVIAYKEKIRLDGDLGLGTPSLEFITKVDPCLGEYQAPAFATPQDPVLATLYREPVTIASTEVLPGITAVEGNTVQIPAGYESLSLIALSDGIPGSYYKINGTQYVFCCIEHFNAEMEKVLCGTAGLALGQSISITACEGMKLEVNVLRHHSERQATITLPARVVSSIPECRIDKNNENLPTTLFFTTDNCGVTAYMDKNGDTVPMSDIDTRYCWPDPATVDLKDAKFLMPEDPKSKYREPCRDCYLDTYTDDQDKTQYEIFFKEYLYNCDTKEWEYQSDTDRDKKPYKIQGKTTKVDQDGQYSIRKDGFWKVGDFWSPAPGIGLGYIIRIMGASNDTKYTDDYGRTVTLPDDFSMAYPATGLSTGVPKVVPGQGAIVLVAYQSKSI